MPIPNTISDELAIDLYRIRFRDNLVGWWYVDNDPNMGWGSEFEFHLNGTGIDRFWDDEELIEDPFLWKQTGEREVEFRPHPQSNDQECELIWRRVNYDFKVHRDGYGTRWVYLIETAGLNDIRSKIEDFWNSPQPVILVSKSEEELWRSRSGIHGA